MKLLIPPHFFEIFNPYNPPKRAMRPYETEKYSLAIESSIERYLNANHQKVNIKKSARTNMYSTP